MTVVVDVGCAQVGGFSSIRHLIREFDPDVLYGFDPNVKDTDAAGHGTRTVVVVSKSAAWTFDGSINYTNRGTGGTVMDGSGVSVPCVDLADFLRRKRSDVRTILKIDAEGSEYPLLEHLISEKVDVLLELAWVEWHPAWDREGTRRRAIENTIGCELAEWRL